MAETLQLLLFEVQPDDVALVQRALRDCPFTPAITVVDNLAAFETALAERDWQVVIADYIVPGSTAIDALAVMQAQGLDLPFIIISGVITDETAVLAMKAGAHDYVMKDNLSRLGPAISRELREAESRRQRRKAETEREHFIEALEAAVRARDEFLSVASHELRTPLTTLQLNVDRLLSRLESDAAVPLEREWLLAQLHRTRSQFDRIEKLINTLLDVSRLTAGRLDFEPEFFDLVSLIRDVVGRYGLSLRKAGMPLTLRLDESLPVHVDPTRIDQVLSNLIENAIKYGPGQPLEIGASAQNGQGVVWVRDLGIGIEPGDHERIFERFERAVSGRHYSGFGLGLWIVRQLLDAMGGTITVDSQPGRGATFRLTLPLASRQQAAS